MLRILSLFTFLPFVLFSQTNTQVIYGSITDKENNEPLVNANIVVLNSDPFLGTVTDLDGYYRLEGVPVGRQDIQITYLGYEPAILFQILVSSGKALNLDATLTESITQVQEVVVSAAKEGKSTLEVTNEMATVSAQSFSLEQSSRFAGGLSDPSRIALAFAGVRNQGDVQNGISVRGNAPTGLLWALEGYEIPNPNHFARDNSQGAVNMISSNLLQKADFYTAAFPAQYGNASSGVFDLYMRKGNPDKLEFSLAAGTVGLESSIEGPINKKKNSSFLVSARYSTLSALNAIGYNLAGNDSPRFFDINYKFHLPTKKAGVFQLFGLYGNSKLSPIEVTDYDYEDSYKLSITGLKHQMRISEKSFLKSALLYSNIQSNFFEESTNDRFNDVGEYRGYRAVIQSLPIQENRIQLDTKVSSKFSAKHSMLAGINIQVPLYKLDYVYSREVYNYRQKFNDFTLKSIRRDSTGARVNTLKIQAFMQQKYRFNENLSVVLGLHFQHFNFNKSFSVEPRVGMEYNYGNGHALNIGVGMHSRLESLGYYGVNIPNIDYATGVLTDGGQQNKYLQPLKAIHFVWGNKFQLAPKLTLQVEGYYQHLYNIPVDTFAFSTHASINYEYSYYSAYNANKGLGRNVGVDITLEKSFYRNYYLLFAGSVYDSKYRDYAGVWHNTRYNGNFNTSVTAGKDIVIGKEKNNRLSLNTRIIWAGNNRRKNELFSNDVFATRLANYFRWDSRVAYIRNKKKYSWTLSLDIQNMTNRLNEAADERVNSQGLIPFLFYKVDF